MLSLWRTFNVSLPTRRAEICGIRNDEKYATRLQSVRDELRANVKLTVKRTDESICMITFGCVRLLLAAAAAGSPI